MSPIAPGLSRKNRLGLALAALLLAACGQASATPSSTAAPPTANATLLPPVVTTSTVPTSPALPAGATAAPPATAAVPASASPAGPVTNQAAFISDLTVPDGTLFAPGATFTKSWRIKNVGTSTWTKDYYVQFALGVNLAAVNKVNLTKDVPPGGNADISVDMIAPQTPGAYSSLWLLVTPAGDKFGVGAKYNEAIYAQIQVIAGGPAITGASSTPPPAATSGAGSTPAPTTSGPLTPAKVTAITVSADNAAYTGDCPHSVVFTAILNIEGGGLVKYQLEASSSTSGFQFQLPAALESNFTSNGPHTFGAAFTLEIRNTMQGEAWLHVLSPNDMSSAKVPFSVTCPVAPTRTPLVFPTDTATAKP